MSKLFALLFTISISVALFYWVLPKKSTIQPTIQEKSDPYVQQKTGISSVEIDVEAIRNNDTLIMYSAMGSSFFSLFGFILSLRSNRKENRLMDLKLKRENLELEKLQTEIKQLQNT